jgi:hypothetical protein
MFGQLQMRASSRTWLCIWALLSLISTARSGILVSAMLDIERCEPREEQRQLNRRLWEASERGSLDGIAESLSDGAEVNSRGPGLWSALHLAARCLPGQSPPPWLCVYCPTRQNHAAWSTLRSGQTFCALGAAETDRTAPTRYGHTSSAERLIEAGARSELRSKAYFTALHHAAMRGHAGESLPPPGSMVP